MECLTLLRHPDSSDSYGVQCRSLSFSLCRGFGSDKLDFGNATLACIPSFQLDRLQAVMNAAARLLFQTNRYDHITPLLRRLHWLRVPQRISFKLAVMMYQCVRGLGPAYLTDAIQPVAMIPGRHRLRSSSTSALDVSSTRLSYCRRTIVSRRRGTNMEQFAS